MIPRTHHPFYETISRMRSDESIILYGNLSLATLAEDAEVIDFLDSEWSNECLEYPGTAPDFDGAAALWAARTVYTAAQLLLHRKSSDGDLPALLPSFNGTIAAGSVLSADLCLRMLPPILVQMAAIDPDDVIIPLLQTHLHQWHYSGIGYGMPAEKPDFSAIHKNICAMQLYADRVISRKDTARAALPEIQPFIKAAMGDFSAYFWK